MNVPLGFAIHDDLYELSAAVIEWIESQKAWNHSSVDDGKISEARQSETFTFPFLSYSLPTFVSDMNRKVWQEMDNYAKKWNFNFLEVEHVSVQRYKASEGQHYKVHVDAGPLFPRVVSGLLYLNDCDGGETYFPHFDFAIQPQAGRLALFPSNFIYAHEAKAPKSGVKYAAAYWARG